MLNVWIVSDLERNEMIRLITKETNEDKKNGSTYVKTALNTRVEPTLFRIKCTGKLSKSEVEVEDWQERTKK